MDFQTKCLVVALNTIKSVELTTPCEPEELCARLDEAGFPNILSPRPMIGRVTGYCEKDEHGQHALIFDSNATREQQRVYICHEVGHMIALHPLTGLICARSSNLSDPREREAEMIGYWLNELITIPNVVRYEMTSDFRMLMERINNRNQGQRGCRSAPRPSWAALFFGRGRR